MDFEIHMTYTGDQERFRKEVSSWLGEHAPMTPEERQRVTRLPAEGGRSEWDGLLGSKGWLIPVAPKQYGGGGLTPQHAVVINEELRKRNLSGGNAGFLLPTIVVHGTEEQKQRFVTPFFRGEINVWQVFTEPEAGSDLASLRTRGVRDGDEWVINGSKQFISGGGKPDWLFTLVNTNPDAPRHENISLIMIPGNLPGITIQKMDLIGMQELGGGQHFVFFDNVRVPADCLIGVEGKGWAYASTSLELEHGGQGTPGGAAQAGQGGGANLTRIIEYLKTGKNPEPEAS